MLIGYARVSTREQNLDLQINALKEAGCKKIFTETASGAQRERPELKAALKYTRPEEGDVLIVWKLDRLARSLKQLIDTVEDLEKQGIGFKSLTESIDTTNSPGKLIFHIFGALAEFERGLIRERTIAGLEAAKALGRKGGRPKKLSPYDLETAKLLLRNQENTLRETALKLNIGESTLYRYLKEENWKRIIE